MKKVILFIIVTLSFCAYSQQWNWAKTISFPYNNPSDNFLASDNGSSFYVTSNFDTNAVILKFNSQGVEMWRFFLYGNVKIKSIVSNGKRIYVSGIFENTMDINSTILTSSGMQDGFIVCFSENGSQLWVKKFGGIKDDGVSGVCKDIKGGINIIG